MSFAKTIFSIASIQMFLYLLVVIRIGLFVLKISFSVFLSPDIQSKMPFLSFKIFLLNFDGMEVKLWLVEDLPPFPFIIR